MMKNQAEIDSFLAVVKELWQQAHYQEAEKQLEALWRSRPPVRTPQFAYSYAYTLYRLRKFAQALQICRIAYRLDSTSPQIRRLYAWIVYRTEIRCQYENERQNILKAARAIVKLCKQEDRFSPYTDTVFRVLELFVHPFAAPAVLEWTGYLNPALLDNRTIKSDDKKWTPKERYYRLRCEALLIDQRSRECIELCQQALQQLDPEHTDNLIWFKRKIALAAFALGEFQDALQILHELIRFQPDWYMEKELAMVYAEMGDDRQALNYASRAALNGEEIRHKINVFKLLVKLYEKTGDTSRAKDHVRLVLTIAREMRWSLRGETTGWIDRYKVDLSQLPSSAVVAQQLKECWVKNKFGDKTLYLGRIESLNHNRTAGLVSREDGRCFGFSRDAFLENVASLRIGMPVTFYLEEEYNRQTKKNVTIAVGLRLAVQT